MSVHPASPLPPALRRDLEAIVGRPWVRTALPDRLAYDNDCWPRGIILTRGRRLGVHQPSAVVQPKDEAEIVELVAWARATGTPIIPFGAGSGVCGGTVALDEHAIVVDLKRLDALLEADPQTLLMRAQPGLIGMNMERELNARGLTLGHFPSSLYCSSVGGYLAARSAGQCSSLYGKIEDMVVSMRVVDGRARLIDTAASPTHPWLEEGLAAQDHPAQITELMVGSEGTLGLITEATLRLQPRPTRQLYRGFEFPSLKLALDAVREMMQQGLRPAVVRVYDEFDSLISGSRRRRGRSSGLSPRGDAHAPSPGALLRGLGKLASKKARELGLAAPVERLVDRAQRELLGRAVGQPLLINRVAESLPAGCLLIVGFEGQNALIDEEAAYARSLLERYGVDLGEAPGRHWLQNRFSVSYKQSPMFDAGTFVDTMEVSTTWENVLPLYQAVRRAVEHEVFIMAHFSHVYAEGCSIYFTFAGFGADLDDTLATYERTWEQGLEAVAAQGGSIAHHHGVGYSKAAFTRHDHPGGPALFADLKARFDPDGILNPSKVYR
ncbi:FAD-binding oxidoreductase [Lujinxingia litoralis]|uniref:FAD-binding oxidoreductase n=1 Tax=Lujinxingia litoralis TaxID=2211119 RepID=A0A328C3A7_9DELT|nr:FAD-binding oxidoreductase [Lujinxingia litoralis]RAL20395.1 FAD-binding oxidoreductase [Lujinxingia litoralis]